MPSSTSSSERSDPAPRGVVEKEGALPAGLRLTASDRPGQAQPVPTRDIPRQPWGRIMLGVLVALVAGMAALEVNARQNFGLHAGDLDNSEVTWTNEKLPRRRARRRRSSAIPASCSTPTSTGSRR